MSDPVQPAPGASARATQARLASARLKREPESEAPERERAWGKGAVGEEKLGRRLNEDARLVGGVGVLHDLALPGKRANIDHIVVGPAGVTVVDAKAWTGKLWIGRRAIGRGRRARRKPIEGMQSQIHRAWTALAASGRDDVHVEGAVCFVNENPGIPSQACGRIDGIAIGTPGAVARHAMRGGRHDVTDVTAIVRILAAAFVVSGGMLLPAEPSRVPAPLPSRRQWRAGRRRVSRRLATAAARAALALAASLVALSLAASLLGSAAHTATTLSEREVLAHRATYRALAEMRAHGAVRGPRVIRDRTRMRFVYRRGRRCRVAITVDRDRLANALASGEVTSARCGPR